MDIRDSCLATIVILLLLSSGLFSYSPLEWVGTEGYKDSGVEPEIGFEKTEFTYKIKYQDKKGRSADKVAVHIDLDGDLFLSDEEVFEMNKLSGDDPKKGIIYQKKIKLSEKVEEANDLVYFFSASVYGKAYKVYTTPLIQGPIIKSNLTFKVEPKEWFVGESLKPGKSYSMNEDDKIIIENTSRTTQNYGLYIAQQDIHSQQEGGWQAVTTSQEVGENEYLLSGIFSNRNEVGISQQSFNKLGNEDVITTELQFADGPTFSKGFYCPAKKVPSQGSVSLWLQMKTPTTVTGPKALKKHDITVTITAQRANRERED